MDMLGVGGDERFATFAGRMAHRDEVESRMCDWIAARPEDEVMAAFEAAQAAIAPVLSMADIAADPHFAARRTIVDVDGTPMQGLVAHLTETPGRIRWAGRPLAADQDDVLGT